jgi:polyphosphate kinase 2 (PPK2 family)
MTESKTSPRRLEAVEKQKQALELRKAGATYEAIAKKLEYANASGAEHAIKAALKATVQDGADAVRQLEVERLDAMLMGLWTTANKGNHGAVDRVLRIMERRARLLGLDAPTKTEISGEALKAYINIDMDKV